MDLGKYSNAGNQKRRTENRENEEQLKEPGSYLGKGRLGIENKTVFKNLQWVGTRAKMRPINLD